MSDRPLIIVVDPDADFATALSSLLDRRGYHVVRRSFGIDALQYVAEDRPELVLSEGRELLYRVRIERRRGRRGEDARHHLIDDHGRVAEGKALDIMQAAPIEGFAARLSGSSDLTTAGGAGLPPLMETVACALTPSESVTRKTNASSGSGLFGV